MRVGDGSIRDGRLAVAPSTSKIHDEPAKRPEAAAAPREAPSPFQRVLHGLGHEMDRGEGMMRRALGGGGQELGTSELLALQAGVYRYSEAVDLSAKLVDRASSGVKTVIQGQ
jgi:hypothetical protein